MQLMYRARLGFAVLLLFGHAAGLALSPAATSSGQRSARDALEAQDVVAHGRFRTTNSVNLRKPAHDAERQQNATIAPLRDESKVDAAAVVVSRNATTPAYALHGLAADADAERAEDEYYKRAEANAASKYNQAQKKKALQNATRAQGYPTMREACRQCHYDHGVKGRCCFAGGIEGDYWASAFSCGYETACFTNKPTCCDCRLGCGDAHCGGEVGVCG